MRLLTILILFYCPLAVLSQSITGKVYDEESIVRGASIANRTQNTATYSDDSGYFKLSAAVNDSIVIRSSFHMEQRLVIKQHHIDEVMVIELKKAVNTLDEVFLKKEPDFKPSDPVETNNALKSQILADIKKNPHLYQKGANGNFDFVAVAKLIGTLFKSNKPKPERETSASYRQLEQLFKTDAYFNAAFLKQELQIPKNYTYLYLEYCEAYAIDSKLLKVENRFLLVGTLLKCSSDFLEILDVQKKE